MKSAAIRDGDLVLEGGAFKLIEGVEKVHQDLSHGLIEPYGVDRYHPRWGSILPDLIGSAADDSVELLITSEIRRVVTNAALVQQGQLEKDRAAGRRPRFSTNELIGGITQIRITREYDRFHVHVVIRTVSGSDVEIDRVVSV